MSVPMTACLVAVLLGQLPTIESEGFTPGVQKDALLATVHILNHQQNIHGTGVIVECSGRFTYILTAAHVVNGADNVEVHVMSAKTYPKESERFKSVAVIVRSANKQPDLAVLRLAGYDGESKGLTICPLKNVPKKKEFRAMSVGCVDKQAPTLLKETVLDVVRAKRTGDAKFCTYFRTERKQSVGRSGGPLIDAKGQLLAICSGAEKGRGFYCHLEDIHQFLIANGLGSLLEGRP